MAITAKEKKSHRERSAHTQDGSTAVLDDGRKASLKRWHLSQDLKEVREWATSEPGRGGMVLAGGYLVCLRNSKMTQVTGRGDARGLMVGQEEGKIMQGLVGCVWAMHVGSCKELGVYSEWCGSHWGIWGRMIWPDFYFSKITVAPVLKMTCRKRGRKQGDRCVRKPFQFSQWEMMEAKTKDVIRRGCKKWLDSGCISQACYRRRDSYREKSVMSPRFLMCTT